jgi:hypothetical protein
VRRSALEKGIARLAAEGRDIVPFLCEAARDAGKQKGRVYWALVVGALSEIGGQDAEQTLHNLAADKSVHTPPHQLARDALDGEVLRSFE